ncbi:CidA/LrgA family protein [Crenobacter cavernae]|uniref:CidA/LrgA family protein n=1 Tax=Crenobacter cavernae TaxID=2290923 RepID=A0A345Y302_9NEIS|nr:CidA/LrgA family protein [Crenobacter cavernae]AXK38304.1 CidA/LrgA family protein [Crenobacter cavernae]
MLETLIWLIGYYLAGEFLARTFAIPLPGSVLGMLLLFVTLCIRRNIPDTFRDHVPPLMQHLSLLFIPSGVGAVLLSARLAEHAFSLAAVLALSTLIPLIACAWLLKRLLGLSEEAK